MDLARGFFGASVLGSKTSWRKASTWRWAPLGRGVGIDARTTQSPANREASSDRVIGLPNPPNAYYAAEVQSVLRHERGNQSKSLGGVTDGKCLGTNTDLSSYKALAAKLGLTAPNLAIDLSVAAGVLGAAHALFALALAFARTRPGHIVLLAGFGSGCDALLFETTEEMPGAADAAAMLGTGFPFTDYVRFLSLTGSLDLDWGARAEFEQKAQPTVLERYGRDMMGFIGGGDLHGNVQFPKSRVPVNPDATGPEPLADVRLADEIGKIISITADRLNFTPDPPFNFGLVQFGNGARVMMEFTDAGADRFTVGDPVRMRFRIKSLDRKRGFRTYFWKAAPAERPQLETA